MGTTTTSVLPYFFLGYVLAHAVIETAYFSVPGILDAYKRTFANVRGLPSSDAVDIRMWPWGALAYVVLVLSVWEFLIKDLARNTNQVITPGVAWRVFARATLLALAVYGIYNFTNAATLGPEYTVRVVLMDTAWGVFAFNALAFAALGVRRVVLV